MGCTLSSTFPLKLPSVLPSIPGTWPFLCSQPSWSRTSTFPLKLPCTPLHPWYLAISLQPAKLELDWTGVWRELELDWTAYDGDILCLCVLRLTTSISASA